MKNILNHLTTKSDGDAVDVVYDEETELLLPQSHDYLSMEQEYRQIMFFYEAGIQQVTAKLEILKKEFQYCNRKHQEPGENVGQYYKQDEKEGASADDWMHDE